MSCLTVCWSKSVSTDNLLQEWMNEWLFSLLIPRNQIFNHFVQQEWRICILNSEYVELFLFWNPVILYFTLYLVPSVELRKTGVHFSGSIWGDRINGPGHPRVLGLAYVGNIKIPSNVWWVIDMVMAFGEYHFSSKALRINNVAHKCLANSILPQDLVSFCLV